MRVTISPSKASGSVRAPLSKSVAHRALICGALTDGCTIMGYEPSRDIDATINCLRALGAKVEQTGNSVYIGGLSLQTIPNNVELYCNESASTLRFLLPLCLLSDRTIIFRGHGRLLNRPMSVYEELCRQCGLFYEKNKDAICVRGPMKVGRYMVRGDISSQFITGILLALSQLNGESILEVIGPLESSSYVDITLSVLRCFGVTIRREENVFYIVGKAPLCCERYEVEGDWSNSAYLEAFNAVGGCVKVIGLTDETPQGDRVYKAFYDDLARNVQRFDLSDCPDLGPIMFALSAAMDGAEFTGTARLRYKESDRCMAMAQELKKFGITMDVLEDTATVLHGTFKAPTEILSGHNDHRVVMALCVLCSLTGGTIDGAEAVDKSFPNYFDVLKSLGVKLKIVE